MRIYAACLASYNNGVLFGRWIDATSDAEKMGDAIKAMLADSKQPGAEEYAIHDYDGVPSSFGEYPSLAAIAEFVELVESFDHLEPEDVAAIVANFGTVEYAREALTDNFAGVWDSFRDYADEQADEMIALHTDDGKDRPFLANYFDYSAFARDLAMEMTTVDVSNGVAIFHP